MISAQEALGRLREGNQRFIADKSNQDSVRHSIRRHELIEQQSPFAIILSCSDSRAPAELIFDQGLGDLFVIRVAGNIVAPSQIASIEYCAQQFGTNLVLVMGHTNCGAVNATLSELQLPQAKRSKNLQAIVSRIQPAVEPLLNSDLSGKELQATAVRANVRTSVLELQNQSDILRNLVSQGDLSIASAEYSLETGQVDFFD